MISNNLSNDVILLTKNSSVNVLENCLNAVYKSINLVSKRNNVSLPWRSCGYVDCDKCLNYYCNYERHRLKCKAQLDLEKALRKARRKKSFFYNNFFYRIFFISFILQNLPQANRLVIIYRTEACSADQPFCKVCLSR